MNDSDPIYNRLQDQADFAGAMTAGNFVRVAAGGATFDTASVPAPDLSGLLPKGGGTMTGPIGFQDPADSNTVYTLEGVDGGVQLTGSMFASGGFSGDGTGLSGLAKLAGGNTLTGNQHFANTGMIRAQGDNSDGFFGYKFQVSLTGNQQGQYLHAVYGQHVQLGNAGEVSWSSSGDNAPAGIDLKVTRPAASTFRVSADGTAGAAVTQLVGRALVGSPLPTDSGDTLTVGGSLRTKGNISVDNNLGVYANVWQGNYLIAQSNAWELGANLPGLWLRGDQKIAWADNTSGAYSSGKTVQLARTGTNTLSVGNGAGGPGHLSVTGALNVGASLTSSIYAGSFSTAAGAGATRVRIDSPDNNTGFILSESGTNRWSVASYGGGNFTLFNESLVANGLTIDPSTNTVTFGGPLALPGYTVATLPTPGIAGRIAYCTDAVKAGGGAGGLPVFDDGSIWCTVDTALAPYTP